MFIIQYFIGIACIILGAIVGIFMGNIFGVAILIGGFILISLSKIVTMMEEINHKVLGIPLTNDQIGTIILKSRNYFVESESLKMYPDNETSYPLIMLDGEYYLNSRVFRNYITVQEYEYTFEFPNKEPLALDCSNSYYNGSEIFKHNDRVYVRLKILEVNMRIYKDRIILG